jgi:EmrB/QacA subfamily drug resistance transporter
MTVGNPNHPVSSLPDSTPATHPTTGSAVAPRAGRTIAILFTAVFMTNLDLFVVNVALPHIGADFHGASLDSLSWVLNAYAIVFAALLVVAGRLADRNGHRGGFLLGLAVFTIGSALCAAATGTGFLVASRVLQAVGAAVLMPTSLALLLASTPAERRSRMVRAWSALGGVAAALGPVVGGLLVQASWRGVFLINVPIGIAAFAAGMRTLPQVRDAARSRLPDLFGAVLLTVSIAALSLGLVQANDWGWSSGRIIGAFVAAAVLLLAFLVSSARHPSPIVELPMLRIRAFSMPTVAILLFSAAFAAMILSSTLWTQNIWGWSALKTGLGIAPGPLMVPPMAAAAGPLGRRIGPGVVAALGGLGFAVGILWWALTVTIHPNYAAGLLPGTLLVGVGVGLVLPTLTAASATALPPQRFATGSGILNMGRQVGAVLGVAILVSILGTPRSASDALTAFRHGWWATVVISVLAAATGLLTRRPELPAPASAGATVARPETSAAA